jgi:hypothetical protein
MMNLLVLKILQMYFPAGDIIHTFEAYNECCAVRKISSNIYKKQSTDRTTMKLADTGLDFPWL